MPLTVGLDLGTYSIKIAANKGTGQQPELVRLGSAYNPTGQFLPVEESALQTLASTIKQLVAEYKLKGLPVHTAMPESMAYSSIITMPMLSDAELASSIHWEAEQHIPVSLDEVNLEYEVLYRPKKGVMGDKMRVLIVAAKKEMIDRLVILFQTAGVELVGLETTGLAVYRGLWKALDTEGARLTLHIGALSSDILITNHSELNLTYTVQTGGLAMTRSLQQLLQLPPQQAEEYKRAYGLDPAQLEGKVKDALMTVCNTLVGEMRKAIQFYHSSHMQSPIRSILLSGASAYLPGLPAFLAETFGMEVDVANPLQGVIVSKDVAVPTDIASYVPCLGLTMRDE